MKKKPLILALGLIIGIQVSASVYATDLAMIDSSTSEKIPASVTLSSDPYLADKRLKDPKFAAEVAKLYATGQGVKQNAKLAYRLYLYAANHGVAEAQYALGLIYADERGPLNIDDGQERALYWLGKAVDQGYKDAQFAYSYLINNTHYDGC
jgi:TPR repeat protein